jgi:N-dimethylarginine dimethylaminohydrolase
MSPAAQTEVGSIRTVLLRHARDAFGGQAKIDREWRALGYGSRPEYVRAVEEYERFQALLEEFGIRIHLVRGADGMSLDSLYVRDAAVVCERGLILGNMGKAARRGEPASIERSCRELGVPVCGSIGGSGRLEGGDVAWVDERTLAVGRGYRTNDEGIRQLRALLGECVDELVVVPLPHWRGPGGVFHLMSIFSPLDVDLALVYSPLLPVPFRELLLQHGIELLEVPEAEFDTMGCNALAVAPRRCVLLEGNPGTRRRLEAVGVEVYEYAGEEISRKGAGGPTCLTRPLVRDAP